MTFRRLRMMLSRKDILPHIRHRGEQSITKGSNHHHTTKRRWVVERTNSWHNRFRKLLVRYEKKLENYFALVCLGCCILIYRRIIWDRFLVRQLSIDEYAGVIKSRFQMVFCSRSIGLYRASRYHHH